MSDLTVGLVAAAVHFAAIAIALLAGYATYGREPRRLRPMAPQNRPPDDLTPGEVAVLAGEGDGAVARAWTATVLDLMARGVIVGGQVAEIAGDGTSETGFGIVRVNEGRNLLEHEEATRSVIAAALHNGPVARVDLRAAIRDSPVGGVRLFATFRDGLQRRLTARAYAIVDARTFGWGVVAVLTVAAAMTALTLATVRAIDASALIPVAVGVFVGAAAGGGLAGALAGRPGLWIGRSDAGSIALGRWSSYRAFLEGTLGEWQTDDIGASRGDPTIAYALALGLMPAAETAWQRAVPRALLDESVPV